MLKAKSQRIHERHGFNLVHRPRNNLETEDEENVCLVCACRFPFSTCRAVASERRLVLNLPSSPENLCTMPVAIDEPRRRA
jgi:hypothetical protein